jgi:hypothetical protein
MSEHHCWYVTGRTLRLALAYALFASLVVANPAFAAEDTELAAQKTAIPDSSVTAPLSANAEQSSIANDVADEDAAKLDLLSPAAGSDAGGGYVLPKTGELLESVLALRRKEKTLVLAIIVYERDGEYFVPVYHLAKDLSFPVTFNPETLRIEGQYFGGPNLFAVDATAKTYEVSGKSYPLPEGSYLTRTGEGADIDDVYVSVDILNKIWPLGFEIDPNALSLDIGTDRRLPSELAEERRKRQEELEERRKRELTPPDENYVFVPNGYKLLGAHSFTLNQTTAWHNNEKELTKDLFVGGRGDLLGTEARYSARFNSAKSEIPELQNFRLLLRRDDYGDGNLLPFGFSSIEVGDTSLYSPELITNGIGGTGFKVSSGRGQVTSHFDEITIEGESTPGWEVEIYRDKTLLDFGTVDDLGQYKFYNIPLNYGTNTIRVVLYGPEGQVEERIEEHEIGRKFLKPGEITYQAGMVFSGNQFVDVSNSNDPNAPLSKSIRVDRGFNEFITTYATFTDQSSFSKKQEQYLTIGADFQALDGVGQAELYKQVGGGEAIDLSYGRNFFGINTSLGASLFNKFESLIAGIGNAVKSGEYTARLSKNFEMGIGRLNLNLSGDLTTYEDKDHPSTSNVQSSQSLVNDYGAFGHSLSSDYRDGELQNRQGQFSFSKTFLKELGVSTTLNYALEPNRRFTSTALDLHYKYEDNFTAFLGATQSLEDSSVRSLDLGASYGFEDFRTNFSMNWDNERGTDLLLGLSTTLGPDPVSKVYKFSNRLDQVPTSLTVRLFHDLDGDRIFSEGDEVAPHTRVILNNKRRSDYSDENGFIDIERAGSQGFTTITIDRDADNFNPFLIPARKDGFATILRSGTKPHIDFPLIMSGSIDGTLKDADDYGMSNITVQLIDDQGQLAAETKTLSGGFYSFQYVRPGRYVVQVDPSHRVFVPPKTVMVASDDLFAYGVDLQVLSNQNLEQAKEAAVADDVGESGRVAHTYHHSAATVGTEEPASTRSDGGVQPAVRTSFSDGRVQPSIRAVRVGEHPDKVRLVLDLSGPADYRITKGDNDSVITLELPDAKPGTESVCETGKNSLLQRCEIEQSADGGTQIKLTGKDRIDVFYNTILPAEAGKNDRIYVDIIRAK